MGTTPVPTIMRIIPKEIVAIRIHLNTTKLNNSSHPNSNSRSKLHCNSHYNSKIRMWQCILDHKVGILTIKVRMRVHQATRNTSNSLQLLNNISSNSHLNPHNKVKQYTSNNRIHSCVRIIIILHKTRRSSQLCRHPPLLYLHRKPVEYVLPR